MRSSSFQSGGFAGRSFAPLSEDQQQRLATWLKEGRVSEGEEIKPGRVYRSGDWIIKFFGPAKGWRNRLRASPALRCARRHAALQEVGAPLPVATLEERGGPSLMVMERIEGRSLAELIDAGDEAALKAFPEFMAGMHHRRIVHGDMHMGQMLWGNGRWYLLDLDGLRSPLRNLRMRPVIENQWARLHYDTREAPRLREMYLRFRDLAGIRDDPDASWKRVLVELRRFERQLEAEGYVRDAAGPQS